MSVWSREEESGIINVCVVAGGEWHYKCSVWSREEESGIINFCVVAGGGEWHYICSVWSREESGIINVLCSRGRRVAL